LECCQVHLETSGRAYQEYLAPVCQYALALRMLGMQSEVWEHCKSSGLDVIENIAGYATDAW
jgi:hypothetical protein